MQSLTTPNLMRWVMNWLFLASWILAEVPAYAASWTATGSLATARNQHTATLLANGKLLVVGGYNNGTYTAENSAELYDPSTGTWSGAGSLATARGEHTATLLSTGKVLVVGSYDGSSNLNSANAELYTPSTGTWSSTASLPTARCCHTATLLATGKVLVAGGGGSDDNPLASAVLLYDPSTGTWSNTGSLVTARYFHTATMLATGKVLVVGGIDNSHNRLSSAELYDPNTGTWSSTASLAIARSYHTATLLTTGKVLVAGGRDQNGNSLTSAVLYDPSTGTWSNTGSLATVRQGHSAIRLVNGRVLVAGGILTSDYNGNYSTSAEVYDPSTGTWSNTASLATARGWYTANLLPTGQVLVAGGFDGTNALNSAELYTDVMTPVAVTAAPSLITSTSAILKGTVNPNGADTLVNFDFGTTTTYGTNIAATPAVIAANAAATSVSAGKTGLTCGTVYHYRVTADNSFGTGLGADRSFTTSACPVDLTITNVVLTPVSPAASGTFSAAVTVKNQGTAAGDGGQLRLWVNQPTVPTCTATGGDKTQAVGTLAAGTSKVVTVTGLNAGAVGIKTLRAFIDATCVKTETNETNNQLVKTYRVVGKADFVVTSLTLTPATPTANGTFALAVSVKNQGTAAGDAGFLDVWNNLATVPTCGTDGTAWADVGIVAAGATKTVTLSLPAGVAGAKTARAYVDSWCETTEVSETNNQLTKAYTVQ